jgi:multidrug transporter EmrE-like cation transporter
MAIVLFAAALHAGSNALVRASADKFQDTVVIVLGAAVWTALLLPLLPVPAVASWPYLAASVAIHVAYFVLVAVSYRAGELSFVYPLMRGSAPALTAVAGVLLINESPSPIALLAALRETSVVFAAIIAAAFLREPVSRLRYLSIFTVRAGAMALKIFQAVLWCCRRFRRSKRPAIPACSQGS